MNVPKTYFSTELLTAAGLGGKWTGAVTFPPAPAIYK